MGYGEKFCQICGISFNVDEPEEAGWAAEGTNYVVDDNPNDPCKAKACENIDRDDGDEKEHPAGPDCTCTQGYSGWRIGVEEMKDITHCICLVAKPEDWEPEPGDHDFEKDALTCFLTGVSAGGIDELEVSGFQPVKHGVEETMIDNFFMNEGHDDYRDLTDDDEAMPMHPGCFEIFKRASLKKFAKVDIDGLFLLRDVMPEEGDMTRFVKFPQGTDLSIVLDQWYFHEPGTEYLAANPVEVPGLQTIVDDCTTQKAQSEVVFSAKSIANPTDPFAKLSPELRLMLLGLLDISDVAELRLASPSFRQLPQRYFRNLVLTHMSWVWEARTLSTQAREIDWHNLWLRLSAADGGAEKDEEERWWLHTVRREAYNRVQDQLQERGIIWGNPEYHKTFQERGPNYDEQCERQVKEAYASGRWPRRKKTEINGLRNRRRVWRDVEEILRRIEVKKAKGEELKFGSPKE